MRPMLQDHKRKKGHISTQNFMGLYIRVISLINSIFHLFIYDVRFNYSELHPTTMYTTFFVIFRLIKNIYLTNISIIMGGNR